MTNPNSTLIIGGGIIGATLALKLAQAKCPVTLIDARPALSEYDWQQKLAQRDARVYALSLASIQLLTEVGAWQRIEASARKADYTQMQVWQINGIGELQFADKQNQTLLGSMVEPFIIEKALYDGFADEQIQPYLTHITGQTVTRLEWLGKQLGYQVTLDNNEQLMAKLLIGADGRGSFVRQQTGIGLKTLDYRQTAICCAIKTEKPHHATARQVFLTDSILALLPLADVNEQDRASPQHWQSIVWSLPKAKAEQYLSLSAEQFAKEIAFASGYELGEVIDIQSIDSFPLTAQHAKQYVKQNLALIGDAGHGVHPLAGQGLNLGMLDITSLTNALLHDYQQQSSWADFATLQRYQRQRYHSNALMMHSFSGLNWLFTTQFRPIQYLRSEGVYQVSKIKPLMKFFTKKASGL